MNFFVRMSLFGWKCVQTKIINEIQAIASTIILGNKIDVIMG